MNSDSDKAIQSSSYRNLHFLDKFIGLDPNIYVTVSRIIYNKKSYNGFIVCMYFDSLFREPSYSPENIISHFVSDMTLLRDIYFYLLKNHEFIDYNNRFLSVFLCIDESWVDAYAEMVYERAFDSIGRVHNQYIAIWTLEDYWRIFDHIFDRFFKDSHEPYIGRFSSLFKTVFSQGQNNRVLSERQENWVKHIIEKYPEEERIVFLFALISETRPELRRFAIKTFLSRNDSYELFEKIQLDTNHWGGSESEIISDLQRRIEFLESLLPYVKGIKYLKHAERIRNRIDFWKAQIEHEELEIICRKLYR